MPLKWKIFLALNFVLSLPAFSFFVLMVIDFLNSHYRKRDYLLASPFLLGMLLITLNGLLNIYLLQRFFPDKVLPVGVRRLNILSLVLNILVAIALLALCIYVTSLVFAYQEQPMDTNRKTLLAIMFLFWLIQVIVLILQGQLPGAIARNNRNRMRSLIDSIGQQ